MEKLKVLIVEDNEDDLILIVRELKKGNYDIEYESVDNENDFIKKLSSKWDVIISDYSLPNFNGFEALKICNSKNIDVPFIIVSGTVGEDIAVEMMRNGAKDYIMKSKLKILLPTVERELYDYKIRTKSKLILQEREVLYDILKDMLRIDSLEGILESIHNNLKKVINVDNCFVALYDPFHDEISFPFFIDKYDKKPPPMKRKVSLTEYVLKTGQSLLSDPQVFAEMSEKYKLEKIGTMSESWLGVPLNIHGKTIGVFVVQSYDKNIIYTQADRLFLEWVAPTIALAIERKQNEEELNKLSRAVEQSFASVVITDVQGNIEYVNPKFLELTGYSIKEVIGKNPRILKSGKTSPEEYQKLWSDILSGNNWRGEFLNKKKNGDLYWESAQISPVKNSEGIIANFIAVKEDITEKKLKEEELIKAKEKAEESEKLKSNFLANMSHELRTPMVGVLGFAELIRECENVNEIKEFAEIIFRSGQRLMQTLNLILDISRIDANKLVLNKNRVDIVKLSKEILSHFKPVAEKKNLKVIFNSDLQEIYCYVDGKTIWDSVSNLVDNAVKYTTEGKIGISIGIDKVKNVASIKVVDSGIGIPEAYHKVIFEEFRQVSEGNNRKYEGTGLGLSIAKKLIEKNGGEISLVSSLGKGSIFTVELPLFISDSPEKNLNEKNSLNSNKHVEILCVDDDISTRDLIRYIIKDKYSITFAEDGKTAVEIAKARKFSLVLMDIGLGTGINGIQTMKEIKTVPGYESIPFITITAYAMQSDKDNFLSSGMTDYISKPFKTSELLELIEKHIK